MNSRIVENYPFENEDDAQLSKLDKLIVELGDGGNIPESMKIASNNSFGLGPKISEKEKATLNYVKKNSRY